MIQEIFHVGSFSVSPFGVMLVVALFTAYAQLRWGLRRLRIGDDEDASAVVFTCGVAGIIGGKVYYAILYGDWRLLYDRAGIVWYGCFVFGLIAFLLTVRRRRLPLASTFDAVAPALALGYGVGRIGCFLVGDDYGKPTDLPWGIAFKVGLPPTTGAVLRQEFGLDVPDRYAAGDLVPVHPTQLYETLLALGIWGLALWLLSRHPRVEEGSKGRGKAKDAPSPAARPGTVFLVTMSLLALERFGIEFLRAKDDRFFGPLTLAQVLSLAILVVLAVVALRRSRRTAD